MQCSNKLLNVKTGGKLGARLCSSHGMHQGREWTTVKEESLSIG